MTTSNYITFILLGVIGLVFLIDFIFNSRKKPLEKSVERFVEKEESLKNNSNPLSWILRRKKNISLSLILIPILKVLTHFFIYPIMEYVKLESVTNPNYNDFQGSVFAKTIDTMSLESMSVGHHFEVMFTDRLELFIPVTLIFLVVVWFFNDKIKAR